MTHVFSETIQRRTRMLFLSVAVMTPCASPAATLPDAPVGQPVHIKVGYQPYFSAAWSALIVKRQELWKKYLPAGSTVEWKAAFKGSEIVDSMLAGGDDIGYVGTMPGMVGTTQRARRDLRILALTSFNDEQCDLFVVRPGAPQFKTPREAIHWMDAKRVAVPAGTCSDMFAQEVFKRENVKPSEYLNQSIAEIRANLLAGELDAAVIWEPTLAFVGSVVGNKTAREVSSGADWGEHDGGEIVVSKTFLDTYPAAVVGMLKAEVEAQRFIVSGYPQNACAVAAYAQAEAPEFQKRQMWYAVYGLPPSAVAGRTGTRFSAHLIFDRPVRDFFSKASQFLSDDRLIAAPMPSDAIVDGPLAQAMLELNVRGSLGDASVHPAAEYPCG